MTQAVPTVGPGPAQPNERIDSLDVLRGFALFGILLVAPLPSVPQQATAQEPASAVTLELRDVRSEGGAAESGDGRRVYFRVDDLIILVPNPGEDFDLSPDGRTVAYVAMEPRHLVVSELPLAAPSYREVVDSVRVPGTTVEWVRGSVLVPNSTDRLQCAVVLVSRGVSAAFYERPDLRQLVLGNRCALAHVRIVGPERPPTPPAEQVVRNAAIGGGRGLLDLLEQVGRTTGHPELDSVPLLLWGFSAAGNFGVSFAATHPERTLGFVRYHSNMRGLAVDLSHLGGFPALIVAGENDDVAGVADSRDFYHQGREHGAEWTFLLEPDMPHYPEGAEFDASVARMLPWIEQVLKRVNRQ